MKCLILKSLLILCPASMALAQTNTYPFPASGNVGIGTTTPNDALDVVSGAIRVRGVATSGLASSGVFDYYNGFTRFISAGANTSTKAGFRFYCANSNSSSVIEAVHIDANGYVGFGTDAPIANVDILVGTKQEIASYTPTSAAGIFDFNQGGVGWVFSRPDDGARTEAIYSYNSAGSAKNNLAISSRSDIVFTAGQGGPNTAPERVRIAENGNFGIGIPNPPFKFSARLSPDNDFFLRNASDWGGGRTNGVAIDTRNDGDSASVPLLLRASNFEFYEGNVGIGTANPTQKLTVNGTIRAKEVIVDTGWSDYVFAPGYALVPLSEVEAHIKEHQHLPGIPSAQEVAEHGITVGEMQAKLLAKIEELTLHQIELEKRVDAQARELSSLKRENFAARQSIDLNTAP